MTPDVQGVLDFPVGARTGKDSRNGLASCRCGVQWVGSWAAHCAAPGCHRTFPTVTLFDAHRCEHQRTERAVS